MKILVDEKIEEGGKLEVTIYPPGFAPKDIALSSDKLIVASANVVGSSQVKTGEGEANKIFLEFIRLSPGDAKKLDVWLWA